MAVMVIFLLVTIATTLGAAGRAAGLPPTLPRTVADILETIAGVLVAVTNIPGVTTNSLGAVTGILGAVADILGVGVAQPLAHPAATASHTALPLVTAIAVVTEGEFVLFLRDKHRVVFALAVHTGKRLFHIVARVAVVGALPAATVVEEETQRISVVVPALAVGGIDAGGIGPSIALDELPVLVHEIDAAVYLSLLTQQFVCQQYSEPAAYGAIQLGYHRSHLAPAHLRPAHIGV